MSCVVCFFLGRHYSENNFYSHGGTNSFTTAAVHLEDLLGIAKAKITLPNSSNSIVFQVHQNYSKKSKVHTQVLGKYNKGDEIHVFATPSNDGKSTKLIFFLAPATAIKDKIQSDFANEETIAALAAHFYVSEFVIEHQIRNHNLARTDTCLG